MMKLDTGKYFQISKPDEGMNFEIDYIVISNVEDGEALDEYGNVNLGFIFDVRLATEKEIADWMEQRRRERAGRSVWSLIDDYASDN